MTKLFDHAVIWFAWWILPQRAAERLLKWLFVRRSGLKASEVSVTITGWR